MGGEDDVVEQGQVGGEGVAVLLRLVGEHVEGRSCQVPRAQRLVERVDVDDESPRQVEEQRPGLHHRELAPPDEIRVRLLPVDVDGDDVRLAQHRLHGGHLGGVAQGEPLCGVVEDDVHPHRLGQHGQLGADVAVADDPQGVPAHLVRAVGALVPHAPVQAGVLDRDAAGQVDDLADGQLHHGARVRVGGVEHADPQARRRLQVHLVRADAERPDGPQPRSGGEDAGADMGLRADPQVVDAVEGADELVLVERARVAHDLDAVGGEDRVGDGVGVLKEQCASHGSILAERRGVRETRPQRVRAPGRDEAGDGERVRSDLSAVAWTKRVRSALRRGRLGGQAHSSMPAGRGREWTTRTSWVARVRATKRSPTPSARISQGSTRTTESNSSPLAAPADRTPTRS